jgi:hypothetical protein
MAGPTDNTDAVYEDSRQTAERTFFLASVDWQTRVLRAAEQLPRSPKPDLDKIMARVRTGFLPGLELKPEQAPKRAFHTRLVLKLVEICSKYGEAELRAYARLLERRGFPPSQAVTELEQHAKETLAEIQKRKWSPQLENVVGLFDNSPWIDGAWHYVEDRIREFLQSDLHNWVWFHQEGWATQDEEADARQAEPEQPVPELEVATIGPEPKSPSIPNVAIERRFPNRAKWLAGRLNERKCKGGAWNVYVLESHRGPDAKTSKKVLTGLWVQDGVLEKIATALSKDTNFKPVAIQDIPND